ncbi:MAG: hypothetical protein FWH05_04105 [Oscillospiraceae bacterium]|nr:hypothetical protein [Oscillospiraceae bacterium]
MKKIMLIISLLLILMVACDFNSSETVIEENVENEEPFAENVKAEMPSEYKKAYRKYFENFDLSTILCIYIGDINNDGFPEIIIPMSAILYYNEGEVFSIDFMRAGIYFKRHYNVETNQFFIDEGSGWASHTRIYDFVDGKYELSCYLRWQRERVNEVEIWHYFMNEEKVDGETYYEKLYFYLDRLDHTSKEQKYISFSSWKLGVNTYCVFCSTCEGKPFDSSDYPFVWGSEEENGVFSAYIEENLGL